MTTTRHKQQTKTFDQLTFDEQAKSINAMINNLQNAMMHHVNHAPNKANARKKCILQTTRFLGRLINRLI
jgi:hypothetical protein